MLLRIDWIFYGMIFGLWTLNPLNRILSEPYVGTTSMQLSLKKALCEEFCTVLVSHICPADQKGTVLILRLIITG